MKFWIPAAVVLLLAGAYLLFYAIVGTESEGAAPLGIANAAGLVAVVIGLVAAFMIFRRASPVR